MEAAVGRREEEKDWNFREINWEGFEKDFGEQLERIPKTRVNLKEEIEERLDRIMDTLKKTVEAKVQRRQETPYGKRWWNKDMSRMRAKAQVLGREL
ncbi:hypothetical protein C0989_007719 [Termitomyces sp. Mn162]|nr:hypothetical protein C0989_007719 [Termitomyces sp. Mn162]